MLLFKKQGPNMAREYDYCLRQAHQALIDKGEDPAWWDIKQRVKHVEFGVIRTFYATRRSTPGPASVEPLGEVFVYDFKTAKTIPVPPSVSPTRRSPEPAAEAAEEAARVIRARQSVHRFFAENCDPVTDAQLAASAIYWANRLDGPIKAAASRIVSLFIQTVIWRNIHLNAARKGSGGVTLAEATDHINAYFAELRALTVARYADYWVSLFYLSDAVHEEMRTYLPQFALDLDSHFEQMVKDRFEPTAPDDEALEPWTMALSRHGCIWVNGRERGVLEAALMDALWKAPRWEAAPISLLRDLTPAEQIHLELDRDGYLPGESPADVRQARIWARILKRSAQGEANPTGLFNAAYSEPSDAEIADALQGIVDRALAGHAGDIETCPHPDCRRRR